MATFTHSIIVPNQLVAAGSQTYELPGQPLSALLVHINPLNEGATANFRYMAVLLSAITNLTVTYKGSAIVAASGADLAALAVLGHNLRIWQSNAVDTANVRRSLVLPIVFSRRPYMLNECFPATNRGELLLTVTWLTRVTGGCRTSHHEGSARV